MVYVLYVGGRCWSGLILKGWLPGESTVANAMGELNLGVYGHSLSPKEHIFDPAGNHSIRKNIVIRYLYLINLASPVSFWNWTADLHFWFEAARHLVCWTRLDPALARPAHWTRNGAIL
jgi:hypothetical protein